VRQFVEHTARFLADFGFPRMSARVLMTLMTAEEESLTSADLQERLGVSAAAISGSVRHLTQVGLLVREPVMGSRRDAYRLHSDGWYEGTVTKGRFFERIGQLLDKGVGAVGGPDTSSGLRVAEMREFFHFWEIQLDEVAEKWRAKKRAVLG
jgi:DNA-binding transcriptional regulator GbsR (MarR family)